MCSLLTIFTNKKFSSDFKYNVELLLKQSKSRGPDDSNSLIIDNNTFLGSNRLQIIGTPGVAQMPFKSLTKDCWIVLNGEIYNHADLRLELQNLGMAFSTDSDIEVIINSYIAWGDDFITKLNGIFSFVIYDRDNAKILAVRDRFGAKPLYYFANDDLISFSSDFQTICDIASSFCSLSINNKSLSTLMMLRFIPGEATIYDNIYKVNRAEYINADLKDLKSIQKVSYWKPKIQLQDFDQSIFNEKLSAAIVRTATADVPCGILLSGGLDSSTVLSILQKSNTNIFATYTCAFDGAEVSESSLQTSNTITTANIDETHLAKLVASQYRVTNKSYTLSTANHENNFVSMLQAFGEPVASPNALGLFLFAESIKCQPSPKIFLCGTGADELLGGYQSLYFKENKNITNVDDCELIKSFSDFDSIASNPIELLDSHFIDTSYITSYLQSSMSSFHNAYKPNELLNQLAIFEFNFALPFWELEQADKLFMNFSFELRPSFLENDFVDYCFTIKSSDKMNKIPLRNAMRGSLPADIIERAKMPSLSTPASILHTTWFKSLIADVINDPCFFWNKDNVNQLLMDSNSEQSFDLIYRIVYIQSWFKNVHNRKHFTFKILE